MLQALAPNQRLECPICLSTFKDPRVLTCGHSFCFECIEDIAPITCAICRRTSAGSRAQLPVNYILKEIVEAIPYGCSVCPNRDNTLDRFWRCNTCKVDFICAGCITDAHRDKKHDVQSLDDIVKTRQHDLTELRNITLCAATLLQTTEKKAADDLAMAEEKAEEVLAVLRTHIVPRFKSTFENLKSVREELLSEITLSESELLDDTVFQETVDEVPNDVAMLHLLENDMKSETEMLLGAVSRASSAIDRVFVNGGIYEEVSIDSEPLRAIPSAPSLSSDPPTSVTPGEVLNTPTPGSEVVNDNSETTCVAATNVIPSAPPLSSHPASPPLHDTPATEESLFPEESL